MLTLIVAPPKALAAEETYNKTFAVASEDDFVSACAEINDAFSLPGNYLIKLKNDVTIEGGKVTFTNKLNNIRILGQGNSIFLKKTTSHPLIDVKTTVTLGKADGSDVLNIDGLNIYDMGYLIYIDDGTLNMYEGVTLKNHRSMGGSMGGGVGLYNKPNNDGAIFNMYGGSIQDNYCNPLSVPFGGGVSMDGALNTFNMYGGTIKNNEAVFGGGIFNTRGGTINIYGGTITENKAPQGIAKEGYEGYGGGILSAGGTVNISGGTISNNIAGKNGGGVFVDRYTYSGTTYFGTCNFLASSTGSIFDNEAATSGDDISARLNSDLNISRYSFTDGTKTYKLFTDASESRAGAGNGTLVTDSVGVELLDFKFVAQALETYTITPLELTNGSVSPSVPETVEIGSDSKEYVFTPTEGYHLKEILVDGTSVGAEAVAAKKYKISNVTSDHTISATFEKDVIVYDPVEVFATYTGKEEIDAVINIDRDEFIKLTLSDGSSYNDVSTDNYSVVASKIFCNLMT